MRRALPLCPKIVPAVRYTHFSLGTKLLAVFTFLDKLFLLCIYISKCIEKSIYLVEKVKGLIIGTRDYMIPHSYHQAAPRMHVPELCHFHRYFYNKMSFASN